MAIKDGDRANFDTLCHAAKTKRLAIMECADAVTGEYRAVICAVNRADNGDYEFVPLGHLATGNPFEQYNPPA